jgi:hypothetical protein
MTAPYNDLDYGCADKIMRYLRAHYRRGVGKRSFYNRGRSDMNITIEAPSGGEYDTYIKKVKERYNRWQWKIMVFKIAYALLLAKLAFDTLTMEVGPKLEFGREFPFNSVFYQAFVNGLLNLTFTIHGWVLVAGLLFGWVWIKKVARNKAHFECPFAACNEEIRIYEPWECPKCRDNKETIPGLFGTFFDQCKKIISRHPISVLPARRYSSLFPTAGQTNLQSVRRVYCRVIMLFRFLPHSLFNNNTYRGIGFNR